MLDGKKSIAIMQPYIFPYLGYFQMVNAVDKFVFYDDVNYIKQGWINRNKILVSNKEYLFTVPLASASSFTAINETYINHNLYNKWRNKTLQTIEQGYKKAPFFTDVYTLIEKCFKADVTKISELAIQSIISVAKYLNLPTQFEVSSDLYADSKGIDKAERLVNICKKNNATHYINAMGGIEIYNKEYFSEKNITLNFIKSNLSPYRQFNNGFIAGLSIIDVLMFNSIEECKSLLNHYELI